MTRSVLSIAFSTHWHDSLGVLWKHMIPVQLQDVIMFTTDLDQADMIIIVNAPAHQHWYIDWDKYSAKIVVFHMEPYIPDRQHMWGIWHDPAKILVNPLHIFKHGPGPNEYNNVEWHLNKTWEQLAKPVTKDPTLANAVSTVVSDMYYEPGHVARLNLCESLASLKSWHIDVWGTCTRKFVNKG